MVPGNFIPFFLALSNGRSLPEVGYFEVSEIEPRHSTRGVLLLNNCHVSAL